MRHLIAALVVLPASLSFTPSYASLHAQRQRRRAEEIESTRSESSADITIYYTSGCQFCTRAKFILDEMGVEWRGINVEDAKARADLVKRVGGETTVPQIFWRDELVGGCVDLESAIADGTLAAKGLRISSSRAKLAKEEHLSRQDSPECVDIMKFYSTVREKEALNIILNESKIIGNSLDFSTIARELQDRSLKLFEECVARDGSGVDYSRLRCSPRMLGFLETANKLTNLDLASLESLSLAVWINLYNAMVLHASVVLGHPKDPKERDFFFGEGAKYRIGPFDLTLDDIEHGILGGSRPDDPRSFSSGDPRRILIVEKPDPRIHFALNCGAKSCPALKLFSEKSLEDELKAVAEAFVSNEVTVNEENGEVILSRLFLWYGRDFTESKKGKLTNAEHEVKLLRVLASLLPFTSSLRAAILAARGRRVHGMGTTTLIYKDYDWQRNDWNGDLGANK